MRFVEALGFFAFIGAAFGVLGYGLLWFVYFCFAYVVPNLINIFPPEGISTVSVDVSAPRELLDAIYGFSWFSGLGAIWSVIFPSELDKLSKRIDSKWAKLETNSVGNILSRTYIVFVGPWWLFVGYATFRAYSHNGYATINNMIGYEADGKTTLFLLACITLLVPLCAFFLIRILHWIRTGEDS
ncbi:hypothetical protein [Thalassospira lucentensis]|uniref:hypothetical protein n=1 Tax=Thalassospira lucentensis TaxID=168935 RepID=UPI003D28692E